MIKLKKMIIPVLAFSLMTSCNFKKTEQGALPDIDVDVDADAGNLPEYDVNWADVNVGTRTETVKVPKVVVVMEEEEVEVPYLDIDMPEGGEKEERTLMAEAEVSGMEHSMEIQEIWATGKKLIVVSELAATGKDLGDKNMRVSDQVTVNAPEDLDVRYYVVGDRPDRFFNKRDKFMRSKADIKDKIGDFKVIYSK